MSATKVIKQRLHDLNMTQIELSERSGMTRQNLNNKLARDNFTTKELEQICIILGLKLKAVSSEGNEYSIVYTEELDQ